MQYQIPMMPAKPISVYDILHGRVQIPTLDIDISKQDMVDIQDRCEDMLNAFVKITETQLRSKN